MNLVGYCIFEFRIAIHKELMEKSKTKKLKPILKSISKEKSQNKKRTNKKNLDH